MTAPRKLLGCGNQQYFNEKRPVNSLLGFSGLDYLKTKVAVDMLARLGVILLLVQVGLESTVAQMLQVGVSASAVATSEPSARLSWVGESEPGCCRERVFTRTFSSAPP